ncbi:hypothetical protein AQJ66_22585 [Streptomyces bungoensis]|uniref:Uncharacterized protein n=1 Tax=Streptomyces bungoensis TaxID=285568 RepID=A0A101SXY8_9ACTN|nr:hypothetical protein AQJ66_22585 [Streptomyces bungoensis]
MTAGGDRRGSTSCPAVVWTRTVVIALVAALAVLVHHEAATAVSHVPSSGTMRAMGADMKHAGFAPTASGDGNACSGMTGPHCSAASVETVKPAPPAAAAVGHTTASSPRTPPTGRSVPGTVGRAPPDLSFLSRLLV